jgi:chemotaxis protein methyltransferase CheR
MPAIVTDYAYLRELVYSHSHNVLEPSHDYLFDARLAQILRRCGLTSLHELVQRLRRCPDPEIERAVAEAMTINETSFFRDGRPFEILRLEVLPQLIAARSKSRCVRIWSAACSTGQEALSIAMLIREHFPSLADWKIHIDGTDVSARAVERARRGVYHRIEINRGLPSRLIARYFKHHDEGWMAKDEIHDFCRFHRADICVSVPPISPTWQYDVVLLRNVMLYFSMATRITLLRRMQRVIAPDGYLLLGSSEQPADAAQWSPIVTGGGCYFRPCARSL